MSAQILTTSNICVETIESIEDEFNITSSNSIIFETNNILIGDVSFSEFCSNIVFGEPINEISSEDIFKVDAGTITNKDEITNMSEYELLSIDCTQITSDETYETGNKEHYINIQGKDKIYIRSENIFVKHHSYNESFHDYTYRMINKKSIDDSVGQYHFSSSSLKLVPVLTDLQKNDRIADVINMGTYVTKKILCNAVTTENIYNSQENKEAQLKLKSNSAIRLNLNDIDKNKNNIFIEDDVGGVRSNINLNQYINYRLDEYGLINIDLEAEPGVDITIYFNRAGLGQGFSNYYNYIPEFQTYKYKVNFKIVLNKPPNIETNIPSIANIGIYDSYHTPTIGPVTDLTTNGIIYDTTGMIDGIFHNTTNTTRYPMTNLTAGNFYNIYADVTNKCTGITYYNILTSAQNVPTIEHVVIDRIAVVNEREIEIEFSPHVTVVPTWHNDPNKLVYFSVKLYDHGDSSKLSNGTDFTHISVETPQTPETSQTSQLRYDIGRDKDIDVDIARTNRENTQLKYRFDVNTLTNYNNPLSDYDNYSDSVIKLEVPSSDGTRNTREHTFSIVSNHTYGNFEMISIPEFTMPTESFVNPDAPTYFSVQYPEGTSYPPSRNNIFQWTRSTNTDSRITKLFYEIFKDTTPRLNKNDLEDASNLNQEGVDPDRILQILQNIGEISANNTRDQVEGIIPGTYKIRAYNFFGQRSVFTTYEVTQLTLTNVKLAPILDADKIWKVSYNVVNPNGTFVVTTDVTTVVPTDVTRPSPIANDSEYFMTNDFNSFTNTTTTTTTPHSVWVQIQDTAMKIKSSNISVRIYQPIIDISAGVYTGSASKNRRYTFTITITTKSLNDTTYFSNSNNAIESFKIRSLTNVASINNMSSQSISATNNSSATITFTVNDFYATPNIIYTNGEAVSYNENVSFSLIATDVYGYSSASTTLTNNTVIISFPNRSTNVIYKGPGHNDGDGAYRKFHLSPEEYSSDFIGYEWQLNTSSMEGKTNSTLSFLDHEDNGEKFGDFRCKILQRNAQGFTRYFYSASLNNPVPVIYNNSFDINSTRTYTFSYSGNGVTSLAESSPYTESSPGLLKLMNDSTVPSRFTQAITYRLQVFVRNIYYFGQWQTIGTFTVVRPTYPIFSTITLNAYNSVTLTGFNWGTNGTPLERDSDGVALVPAYTYTNNSPSRITLNPSSQSVTPSSQFVTGLNQGTEYTFTIYKQYTDYGEFASNSLSITTPRAVSFGTPSKDFHSVTVNYTLNLDIGSYTLYSEYPKLIWTRDSQTYTINNLSGSSYKIVIGRNESINNVKIQKKFNDTTNSILETIYGSPTAIAVNTVTPPGNPSITSTSVSGKQITFTISTNHTNTSYPYPNQIHLYYNGGGSWLYINITLNAANKYTFTAANYNTQYTFYIETRYHNFNDGKPDTNRTSAQVNERTDPRPPESPILLSDTIHSLFINLSWTGEENYDATGVTYSINLNGSDVKTDLPSTTTNYLLTWRSDEGNLRQNTPYTIYIKKVYSLSGIPGLYTQSGSISRTTLSGPYPSINTTSSSVTHNSINLVWTTGSRATDNISTSNIKYRIEVRKMSGPSEGGVVELNKGYINDISYTTNNYTITNYTSSSGTTYNIEPNSTYYINVYKNITYYSSANIKDWSSFSNYRVTTPQYVEPYWPNITSNSIDGKEITITYSTGDPGSRTRSGVELSISKTGGGFSTIIQFSIYSTTGSHTETLPEYDTEYIFQMAVKYDSNTYTKFQSGYNTYRTEEEPLEPYWPNITSNSIDGKEITITYSTGDPGSRTRSGVELSISKTGGGFSTIIQFSIYSTTGSHTETLPEYDTEYIFQMAVKYDSNTYTKFQSGYNTYRTEEEPLDSSGWTLINENGLGIDYGRWDSLINNNGSRVAKIGINTFPFSSYTLNEVKDIANTYSDAFYIVDNRRSDHLNYYIHDGSRNVTSYNNPDGAIYVWSKNTSTG